MKKIQISNCDVLNEAYDYEQPSAFSRGIIVTLPNPSRLIYISGTASIDEQGKTINIGNFREQTMRTFSNITGLLKASGVSWINVVKTTIYIKNINRDYDEFNKIRSKFYAEQDLQMYPASVCVQAHLCRDELLVEIEAQAIVEG